jgi:nucleotide-binding universal stress UspA family protein
VTLYSVCGSQEHETADGEVAEVVRYLARHGIHAEPVIAPAGKQSAGRQILDEAMARESGLIVAGAYGHARLREWALGGVTRDLIADSTVCLMLAH